MRLGPKGPKRCTTDEMTLGIEGVLDGGVGGEEALSRGLAFEQLHVPLAFSDRQM